MQSTFTKKLSKYAKTLVVTWFRPLLNVVEVFFWKFCDQRVKFTPYLANAVNFYEKKLSPLGTFDW